jgi:predicted HicB family RNase H-like nuclease
MDTIDYKGYRGTVRYSADDHILHGRIVGISDVVNYEGATVEELEAAFREAVEDYLALCEKLGKAPERSYSGQIPLRIDQELHRQVAVAAELTGDSVNGWISKLLSAAMPAPRQKPPGRRKKAAAAARKRAK